MPCICPYCKSEFKGVVVNSRHKAICEGWSKADPLPLCLCGHVSTSRTQMKRHRVDCMIWQSRDAKAVKKTLSEATSMRRYGVPNGTQAPEVQARRKATIQEMYGVDNLFQSEEIKRRCRETMLDRYGVEHNSQVAECAEKRRVTNLDRRGVENPFQADDVKKKLRETMSDRYGASNPQQVPEIRSRSKATNMDRYGGELLGSPILRAKSEATNLERYGSAYAGGTPEVQAKVIATNMERYGVPHTCMDPEVRQRQLETQIKHYGSHYFASEIGMREIRSIMRDHYGCDHVTRIPGVYGKIAETNKARYGYTYPLQNPEICQKMLDTKLEKYGSPMGPLCDAGPNGLERKVQALEPRLLFMGNHKFWRYLPLMGYRNPDFIVPGPDPEHPKRGVAKVVEAFGDYWHSEKFTGTTPEKHEREVIVAYADIGIACLVLWESEVKQDPENVRDRIHKFLER